MRITFALFRCASICDSRPSHVRAEGAGACVSAPDADATTTTTPSRTVAVRGRLAGMSAMYLQFDSDAMQIRQRDCRYNPPHAVPAITTPRQPSVIDVGQLLDDGRWTAYQQRLVFL